ncbi:hypothetical protein [Caballeronia sp. SL2Y3]|uniref:hypothetical protein n=1 Tax=Caballeronia sp. SL2Y3 TaxID=2878151 RepID=UPI001FD34A88|nr:hypothetical protein [Caballeronia sp. SL2Y3]
MTGVVFQRFQGAEIPGVRQLVDVEYRFVRAFEPIQDKIGADETGAARRKNHKYPLAAFSLLTDSTREYVKKMRMRRKRDAPYRHV